MEYKEISFENFGKICRTCLSEESLMPFSTTALEDGTEEGLSIVDVLSNFIPLTDLENEEFPQQICLVCIDRLNQFCDFIKNCNKNEKVFKSCLGLGSCVIDPEYSKLHSMEEIKDEDDDNVSNNRYPPFEPPSDDDLPQVNKVVKSEVKSSGPKRQKVKTPLHKHKKKQTSCEKKLALKRANVQGNEQKPYTCLICNKSFQRKYQMTYHTRVHTKEKPYKCGQCNATFSLKGNLRRHSKIHTGEKKHICEICGKGFIQAPSLKIHRETHGAKHFKEERSQLGFPCKICSRVFVMVVPYRVHMKKYHPNEQEALTEESQQVKAGSQQQAEHKCETCGRKFTRLALLRSHEARHGEKKFLCSECGKGFTGKPNLLSHMKVHTGEKSHKCPICNKSFAHGGTLASHSLTHSGFRPYSCHLCDKSFTQLSHLKGHQRTHSGDRPYSCTYCGKTFAQKINLTVHTRTHTGETPYVCTMCGKGFYDSSSMKKHKNSHLILPLAEDNSKEESI